MSKVTFGRYTITLVPDEVCIIKYKDRPATHATVRISPDFDDEEDRLVISQLNPTYVQAVTKHFQLIIGYDTDPNVEDPENSGRYELYFRESEDDGFVQNVFFRLGVPRTITENMMAFLQNPDHFHEQAPNYLTNNNNNDNNNNDNNNSTVRSNASGNSNNNSLFGGRRKKRTRKQKRRT